MLDVHPPHEPIYTWKGFAVHIATIVIGLLIAVGLEQSVEYVHRRHQAEIFEEHLRADLREEDWTYEFLLTYNREVLAHAERAVLALEGKTVLPNEALLISAYRATQYKNRLRRRATFDELISTGTISLIRDQRLRITAMQVYNSPTLDVLAREGQESRYREAFRMSLPTDVQRMLNRECGDRYVQPGDFSALQGVLDHPCSTGLPPQVIDEAVKALRSDPKLIGILRLRIADLDTRLVDLTSNNRVLFENLRTIAKQAGAPVGK